MIQDCATTSFIITKNYSFCQIFVLLYIFSVRDSFCGSKLLGNETIIEVRMRATTASV